MLSAEQCEHFKRATFVADVESFDELPSTNDHAVARCGAPDLDRPLLVVAGRQTAGRGRGANRWWSNDGALTFSLLLGKQHLAPHGQAAPMMSLAIGVAVCDAIAAVDASLRVGLKWPNDVFVAGRKIAGVLIECPSSATGDFVIGIGVNVNNSLKQAPGDIAQRATSLFELTGEPSELFIVLTNILNNMEHQLTQMHADPQRVAQRWSGLCILEGKQIVLSHGGRRIAGLCRGIAESGALLIESGSQTIECLAGVVEQIGPTSEPEA